MTELTHRVQVCVPFTRLRDELLGHFAAEGLNPEIGLDAACLEGCAEREFTEVAGVLRRHGLTVTLHAPFVDLSAGSTDAAVRAVTRRRFDQVLALVPVLRPLTVVAHAGYDWRRYEYFRGVWMDYSAGFWSEVAGRLNAAGSRLMLENVYEERPEEIRELFERLRPENVGFCLDAGHCAAFGRAPLAEWLEVLGPAIGQLHLHDNHGRRDEHLPMGGGGIDFGALFAYLRRHGRRPPVMTLEVHRFEDLGPSLAHLERLWPW